MEGGGVNCLSGWFSRNGFKRLILRAGCPRYEYGSRGPSGDEEGGFGEEGEGFGDVFGGAFLRGEVGVGRGFLWGVGFDEVGDECDEGGFVVEAVEVGEEETGGFGELDGFEAELGNFFVGGGADAGVGGGRWGGRRGWW